MRKILTLLVAAAMAVAGLLSLAIPAQAAGYAQSTGYVLDSPEGLRLTNHWSATAGCGGTCYAHSFAEADDLTTGGFLEVTWRAGRDGNSNCKTDSKTYSGAANHAESDYIGGCNTSGNLHPYVHYTIKRWIHSTQVNHNITFYLCGKIVTNGVVQDSGDASCY